MPRKTSRRLPRYDAERPLDPDDAQFLLSLGVQAALHGEERLARTLIGLGERVLRAKTLMLALEPTVFDWKAEMLEDLAAEWEASRPARSAPPKDEPQA